MQSEIFQAFMCYNFEDYGLQFMKTQNSELEYCEKVPYCRLKVSHSKQLINPKHLKRVPEPLNGLSGCFSRIHNHGEDLTVVQKAIIDTLHKEGKPQKVIAKEVGCSQSAVSKHINRKLSGRAKSGRKRCTSSRDDRSLERIVR